LSGSTTSGAWQGVWGRKTEGEIIFDSRGENFFAVSVFVSSNFFVWEGGGINTVRRNKCNSILQQPHKIRSLARRNFFDSSGENFLQWLWSHIFVCEREEGSARWEETSASLNFFTVEERTFESICWESDVIIQRLFFSLDSTVGGWQKWGCFFFFSFDR
jgi:hypothetical protein